MNHSKAPAGFDRKLINGNMQIKSICAACGVEIIESAANGLEEKEANHRAACKKTAIHLKGSSSPRSFGI
jgi:hypothetical protein